MNTEVAALGATPCMPCTADAGTDSILLTNAVVGVPAAVSHAATARRDAVSSAAAAGGSAAFSVGCGIRRWLRCGADCTGLGRQCDTISRMAGDSGSHALM